MIRPTLIQSYLCGLALAISCTASLHAHGFKALVFTKGTTHASTTNGVDAINALGLAHDFDVTVTADAATFNTALATHQVVIFLNTEGDVLNAAQQTAFRSWYENGGGFLGIHSAVDTEPAWSWYGDLVGARGASETISQSGTVKFMDQVHPITDSGSPRVLEWSVTDQWHNFTTSPRGTVHVLSVLDEKIPNISIMGEADDTGIVGGTHGNDHPIMWCRYFDGGRTAYLGPGHNSAVFSDTTYQDILANSIEWAAGETGGESGATIDGNFEKVVLDADLTAPMSIDVAADGRVFIMERFGAVKVHDQASGVTSLIGTLDEYSGGEYGGLAIVLAPDFELSNQLYIQWSPTTGNNTRVSRFTLDGAGNLDLGSEVVILEYFTNRPTVYGATGHHQAGCLRFDPAGNLLISVGDNTQASQYSPRGSIARDARKSAANTNDLRGSILRITPNVGGGPASHPNYTIPAGNLYAPGTPLTREEIYVKGARNPFRFSVDPVNGWIYYGDVGPDATLPGTGALEGPGGHDEFNQVKAAGWFGWPYYIGNSKPYTDGNSVEWTSSSLQADLASYFTQSSFTGGGGVAGAPGLLVNPQPAWIWYPDGEAAPPFSEIGTNESRCAMAGAVYQYTAGNNLPAYYDKSVFLMLWGRDKILEAKVRPDGSLLELTEFAPNLAFDNPHDMCIGPDGAMYLIEWDRKDLLKVQFTPDVATPVAVVAADVTSGGVPLNVQFSSAGSFDPDSALITFEWNFGDGSPVSTVANPSHTFTSAGTYTVQLTVTDAESLFGRANLTVSVGNYAPVVTFVQPFDHSFFDWGDTVNFDFTVSDQEDGTSAAGDISDANVLFEASLLHSTHQHNEAQAYALTGNLWIPRDDSHPFDLDLGYVLEAYYTDNGAPGVDPIQGTSNVTLQPKVTMAQSFDGQSGVATLLTNDPVGGDYDVTSISSGDHIYFSDLNLASITAIRLRMSAPTSGATVQIRQDSASGPLIGTVAVTQTSGYQDFETALSNVQPGSHDNYFVFSGVGSSDLRFNWIVFRGQGATYQPQRPVVSDSSIVAADTLRITFDQEMDDATLGLLSNYSVDNGASIVSVSPAADQKSVDLLFGGAAVDSYYTVSMNGIEDLAGDAMDSGSKVTFLMQDVTVSSYYTGLNAGGANYTDSMGNLYLSDANIPVSLLVDFTGAGSTAEPKVNSSASDFAVGDPAVPSSGTVNAFTTNPGTTTSLVGANITGATIQSSGSSIFSTDKGNLDDLPILDGYLYTSTPRTVTLGGLGDIADGSPMKLTLWGVGDSANSDASFTVSHNGASLGTLTTDYDTATAANTAPARVQFTFNKAAGDDTITIVWGKGSSATAGFNGFSLTGYASAVYYDVGTAKSYTAAIANTIDDTLYQTERFQNGNMTYSIPVPAGIYDVQLRFAENYYTAAGSRIFNVTVEGGGNVFTPNLDIAANVGGNAAFDQMVSNISVTDGVLNVSLVKGAVENPKVSAIGVFRHITSASSLPDPSFARFLHDHPDSLQSAFSDVDSDSLTSLMEYALGGSDSAEDSALLPVLSATGGGEHSLTFKRPTGLPDVDYEILASSDLASWLPIDPTEVTTSLGGGMEQVQMNGLVAAASTAGVPSGSSLYFRMKVSLKSIQP